MSKKILLIIVFLFALAGAWFGYKMTKPQPAQRTVLSVLPEDAIYILKTKQLTDAWEEISKTNIWQHFISTKGFENMQSIDTILNKTLIQNKTSKYIFKNRPTAMAAYMTTKNDYDFIYSIDLQKSDYLKQILGKLLEFESEYKVVNLTYKNEKIYKLIDKKTPNSIFYISTLDNVLIAGFSFKLIKKALDEKAQTHWINEYVLQKINNELSDGLIQLYFNYNQLPSFLSIYTSEQSKLSYNLKNELELSGFDINQEDNRITMDGYTITDKEPSYMNALLDVKPGKISSYRIASQQTAMITSIGFKNFDLFYQSLLDQYSNSDKKKKQAYRQNIKKLESFLKIDLQRDMFDWIGQEISLLKMRSDNKQNPADLVLLIQANTPADAKLGLNRITEQIRKRSPFKFKSYNYKNFDINYLHQKTFFKTILGDLFDKIEKPYFTYIEDFVVFSNSEKVLKQFLDDYIMGKTLSHDEVFMDFKDNLQNKSNVFVYIQMPKLYDILQKSLTVKTRQSLQEKKDFLLSFSRIGLQLIAKDDSFKTLVLMDHDEKALQKEQAEQLAKQVDKSIHHTFFEDLQFKIAFADSLQVADGDYQKYYNNSKTLKMEGRVKNGLPIGIWRTYYSSGNLQSVANYNEGELQGDVFYYFDTKPEKLMVETHYDDDLLEGDYLEYWSNGAQKANLHYKDGKLSGEALYFYQTGKIKIKGKYRHGEKKGKWLFYNQKGKEIRSKRYSGFLF